MEDSRIDSVRWLLEDYVKSPSLRHIRDPYMLNKLARKITRIFTAGAPIWRKWEEPREALVKAALACWIPVEDLRDYLNEMPGPTLTTTDVEQRLRALWEEPFTAYPKDDLKAGCLAIYEREKGAGTELPAIVGALQEYVEREEERLRQERETAWRKRVEEEKAALEQRFLSGADCKWTPIRGSKDLYCRINGRAYRLSPARDKKLNLYRIESADDSDGPLIGTYQNRGSVTKVLSKMAYEPEPRW